MSNYATKQYAAEVDTSNFAAKRDFLDLKTEVGKKDIDKLIKVTIGLHNFKKVDDLDFDKLTMFLWIWKIK